jgi:hypothetical protein
VHLICNGMNAISKANRTGATAIDRNGAKANGTKLHGQRKNLGRMMASAFPMLCPQYNAGR